MSKAIDRVRRMLSLLAYLGTKPDGVTVDEASRDLAISSDDVITDALNLANYCSLPGGAGGDYIEIDISGSRLRLMNAQGLDRPLRLTVDEGMALAVAARSLSLIPGVAAPEVLESAIEVLERAAVPGRDVNVAVGIADSPVRSDPGVMAAITTAVSEQRALRIEHLSGARDEATSRTIDPVGVLRRGAHSYLRAWCRQAEGMRTFRTDRITAVEVLAEPSQPHSIDDEPDFDPAPNPVDLPETSVLLAKSRNWQADYLPHLHKEYLPDGAVRLLIALSDESWAQRIVMAAGGALRLPDRPDIERAAAAAAAMALRNYPASGPTG